VKTEWVAAGAPLPPPFPSAPPSSAKLPAFCREANEQTEDL
jgi:hypothetical protein